MPQTSRPNNESRDRSTLFQKTHRKARFFALAGLLTLSLFGVQSQIHAQVPVIVSTANVTVTQGTAFSYKISAINRAVSFGALGLPIGLTLNATTGIITGVPTAPGNASVTLSATNGSGSGTKVLALKVNPRPPVITSPASMNLIAGAPFSYQITASNNPSGYGASGLPAGLTINATSGLLGGTPAAAGNATVVLSATNGGGTTNKPLALVITSGIPLITSPSSVSITQGVAFSYKISATHSPVAFAASGLPSGLTVNASTGLISGAPAAAGNSTVTLRASNASGNATKQLVLVVNPRPPVITSASSASARATVPFSYQISAMNNPTSFSATGLPGGLTVNATSGVISGTPLAAGNATISLSATNQSGSATKALALRIERPPLRIGGSQIPSGVLRQPHVGHTFTATGGSGGNVWSIVDGYPPPGMTFNATAARLAGTPTNAGSFIFGLRVKDSSGAVDEVEVVLEILNPDNPTTVADVFSVMPASAAAQSPGNASCTFAYTPSGSTWTAGLNEHAVFLASLTTQDFQIGIGKGGQIYSLRTNFGETIAPQRVEAPWVDEVWQFVATNREIVAPIIAFQETSSANRTLGYPMEYYIHQAGIYLQGRTGNDIVGAPTVPFYSPVLKMKWDAATRTFSVVSWSQQPRSPNVWKSGMLTYASYRDLGNGTIEATNVITNFGEQDLTMVSTPWGGVRHSTLPQQILSKTAGAWQRVSYNFPSPTFNMADTGGWHAWTQNSTNNSSPSLAVVFGTDSSERSDWLPIRRFMRFGTAGDTATRNYQAFSAIGFPVIKPGHTVAARWYLVAGGFGVVRSKASALSSHANLWMPETDTSKLTPVWIHNGSPSSTGSGMPSMYLYAQPVPGAVPVFAMEDTRTGYIFATLDPYELCPTAPFPNPLPASHAKRALYQNRVVYYQYNSPGVVRDLLGYACREARATGNDTQVTLPGAGGVPLKVWVPTR